MYDTGIFNTHSRTHDSLTTTKRDVFPFFSLFSFFIEFLCVAALPAVKPYQTVCTRMLLWYQIKFWTMSAAWKLRTVKKNTKIEMIFSLTNALTNSLIQLFNMKCVRVVPFGYSACVYVFTVLLHAYTHMNIHSNAFARLRITKLLLLFCFAFRILLRFF